MRLTAHDTVVFLLAIAAMLFTARFFVEIVRKFRQPVIIGELIAGIILGPGILGYYFPDYFQLLFRSSLVTIALEGLTVLGIIMLLIVTGLEIDLSVLVRQRKTAVVTSFFSFVFPFILGSTLIIYFPWLLGVEKPNIIFGVYMGTVLAITALPVVIRSLMELKILNTDIGLTIVASAMFIDLAGWLIFSLILGFAGSAESGFNIFEKVILVIVFTLVTLILLRKLIHIILPHIQTKLIFPGGVLNFVFIAGFLAAAFTEFIGVHAIFGAFIMGIAIGDAPSLKEETREVLQQFVTNIFAPLFFVSIGLRVNFIANFDVITLLTLLLISVSTKFTGSLLGARLSGFTMDKAMVIAIGMNSYGAMEIILGVTALQFKLIDERIFVAIALQALLTSILAPYLMNNILTRKQIYRTVSSLLGKGGTIISNANTYEQVIKELANHASKKTGLPSSLIFSEVIKRETEMSTGLTNGVAVPHAKIDIKYPFISAAFVPSGVDFRAFDGKPSYLVFLLLTNPSDSAFQLEALSVIAKTASAGSALEEVISCVERTDFEKKLLNLVTAIEK